MLVEIDGAHKGPNAPSHDDWTRRQTAFVADAWEVLRFTNRQVMHEQEYSQRQMASTILRERSRLTSVQSASPPASAPAPAARSIQLPVEEPPAVRVPPARGRPRTLLPAAIFVGVALIVALNQHEGPSAESSAGTSAALTSTTPIDDGRNVGFIVCPPSHSTKGNVNQRGERLFHRPGDRFYSRTKPEMCFASDTAAVSAGYGQPPADPATA